MLQDYERKIRYLYERSPSEGWFINSWNVLKLQLPVLFGLPVTQFAYIEVISNFI